jgi:hypothetical protein
MAPVLCVAVSHGDLVVRVHTAVHGIEKMSRDSMNRWLCRGVQAEQPVGTMR